MDKYTYDVGVEDILVILDVQGDLEVKGDDIVQVMIKADSAEDLQVDQQEDQITIHCRSDCRLRVPTQAQLRVEKVQGDLVIKSVDGEVEIKEAQGDVNLRRIGPLMIDKVQGACEARGVSGNFEAGNILGNLSVRDVQGDLLSRHVTGNLVLENVDDNVEAQAGGNAVLRLDPAPGHNYDIQVSGNIAWSMPEDSSAEVSITSAGRIIVNMPGVDPKPWKSPCTVAIGEGDAEVNLKAGGNVVLSAQGPRLDIGNLADMELNFDAEETSRDMAEHINQQIEAQMAMLEQQLEAHLENLSVNLSSSGLSAEQIGRIQERAREASERANERAQERMRRAQERLERKLASVQMRAEQRARQAEQRARQTEERARRMEERMQKRSWNFTWPDTPRTPVPPIPPVPPSPRGPVGPIPPVPPVGDPVTDEERLTILRMLQDKKITLEQAEKLLAALEGKE